MDQRTGRTDQRHPAAQHRLVLVVGYGSNPAAQNALQAAAGPGRTPAGGARCHTRAGPQMTSLSRSVSAAFSAQRRSSGPSTPSISLPDNWFKDVQRAGGEHLMFGRPLLPAPRDPVRGSVGAGEAAVVA